jgi:hypothetical protein
MLYRASLKLLMFYIRLGLIGCRNVPCYTGQNIRWFGRQKPPSRGRATPNVHFDKKIILRCNFGDTERAHLLPHE